MRSLEPAAILHMAGYNCEDTPNSGICGHPHPSHQDPPHPGDLSVFQGTEGHGDPPCSSLHSCSGGNSQDGSADTFAALPRVISKS